MHYGTCSSFPVKPVICTDLYLCVFLYYLESGDRQENHDGVRSTHLWLKTVGVAETGEGRGRRRGGGRGRRAGGGVTLRRRAPPEGGA